MRQFITSMSAEGYEQYGKTFLERATECLPGEIVVYTEDPIASEATEKLKWRDLNEVAGYRWFQEGISRFPAMHGRISGDQRNYRYDISKFCRKSFAQIDAACYNQDEMWWIDADVEFKAPIPEDFFANQVKGVFLAYLGRQGWHSCASLLGFNNAHRQAADFWATYMGLYATGTVFALVEWHDSYLIDQLREQLGIVSRDMAAGKSASEGPYNVFDVVLDEYAHHKKGNLKKHRNRYDQLIEMVGRLKPRMVLEVGTWSGDRALEMHKVNPDMQYIGFDLFEMANEQTDADEMNVKRHFQADDVSRKLGEAGLKYGLYGGFTRDTLPKYIQDYGEKSADFIFIDGGHSYETIKSDLEYALKIIQEGGVIVMDDFYEGMPEDQLAAFGCQTVLADMAVHHTVLPVADPVKGGGTTKMAVIQC